MQLLCTALYWCCSLWVCAIYCYYVKFFIDVIYCGCGQYTVIVYSSSLVSFTMGMSNILLLCTALHDIVLCGCVQYTVIMYCSSLYRSLWVCAIYCYYVLLFMVSFSVGVCNILLLCTALHGIVLCGCVQYTVIMYCSSWFRSLWVWSIYCYSVLLFMVSFPVGVCNILLLCTALHGFVLCGCGQYTVILYCSSWYRSLWVCAICCYYVLVFMVLFSVGVCNILLLYTALHGIVLCVCVQYTVIMYCSSWYRSLCVCVQYTVIMYSSSWYRSLWVCAIYCYYVLLFMVSFSVGVCNILLLCTALHGIVLCGCVQYTVIMYCSSWFRSLWVWSIYCYSVLLFMVSFPVGVCNILLLCTALCGFVLCGCGQYTVILYCSSWYRSLCVCAIYCYYVLLFMVSFSVGVCNILLLCTALHDIVLCGCVQYTVIMYCSS